MNYGCLRGKCSQALDETKSSGGLQSPENAAKIVTNKQTKPGNLVIEDGAV